MAGCHHRALGALFSPCIIRRLRGANIRGYLLPQFEHIEHDERPLQHEQFLKINPTKVEPWRSMMEHNSPGQEPASLSLIAQGTADITVNPEIATRFGEALRRPARLRCYPAAKAQPLIPVRLEQMRFHELRGRKGREPIFIFSNVLYIGR